MVNTIGIPRIAYTNCCCPLIFNSIRSVGTSVSNLIGSGVSNTLMIASPVPGANELVCPTFNLRLTCTDAPYEIACVRLVSSDVALLQELTLDVEMSPYFKSL